MGFFLLYKKVDIGEDYSKTKKAEVQAEIDRMPPDEQQKYFEEEKRRLAEANQLIQEVAATQNYGQINEAMLCPHCQTRGKIRTKLAKSDKGVSGGKATAAVLTGGLSILATGLSRTERVTQAHCDNCNNTWYF